jgi:hypothetical protein
MAMEMYLLGNAIKYISRAGKKGDYVTDLKKAIWYLDREIKKNRIRRWNGIYRVTGGDK